MMKRVLEHLRFEFFGRNSYGNMIHAPFTALTSRERLAA